MSSKVLKEIDLNEMSVAQESPKLLNSSSLGLKSTSETLNFQESPIRKRRRGRPSLASSNSLTSPASLNSMAALKQGTPSFKSPIMKVPTTNTKKSTRNILNTDSAGSDGGKQYTPITRKLFAIKKELELSNALGIVHDGKSVVTPSKNSKSQNNSVFNDSPNSFKTPLSKRKNRNILNSSPIIGSNSRASTSGCLIDPNNLVFSQNFNKSKASIFRPNEFFSSPSAIQNENIFNELVIASNDKAGKQDIKIEETNEDNFNFSTMIQSSPLYHGYYLNTPGSHSKSSSASGSNKKNNTNQRLVKLSVKPLDMKPVPSLNIMDQILDDSDDDYDDDFDLPVAKKQKPLLPPISMDKFDLSSEEEEANETLQYYCSKIAHRRVESSPTKEHAECKQSNDRFTSKSNYKAPRSLKLVVDSNGKACLTVEESNAALEPESTHNHTRSEPNLQNNDKNFNFIDSSPFLAEQLDEPFTEYNEIDIDPFNAYTDQRNLSNYFNQIHTDDTIESDFDEERLLQNLMVSSNIDVAENNDKDCTNVGDETDDFIDPCDARIALLRILQ